MPGSSSSRQGSTQLECSLEDLEMLVEILWIQYDKSPEDRNLDFANQWYAGIMDPHYGQLEAWSRGTERVEKLKRIGYQLMTDMQGEARLDKYEVQVVVDRLLRRLPMPARMAMAEGELSIQENMNQTRLGESQTGLQERLSVPSYSMASIEEEEELLQDLNRQSSPSTGHNQPPAQYIDPSMLHTNDLAGTFNSAPGQNMLPNLYNADNLSLNIPQIDRSNREYTSRLNQNSKCAPISQCELCS